MGKTDDEIAAGLEAGVLMFNVESEAELEAIARVAAAMNRVAPIALRVNPDVDPKTHRYISTGKKESKFGMDIERTLRVAEAAVSMRVVRMIGMHMHIGSQITTIEPYAGAVAKGVELIGRLRGMGHPIAWYNMGGGYGIAYKGREARPIAEFAAAIVPAIKAAGCRLAIEPGRVIAGQRGHPGQPCVIYQAVGRQAVPDPGRRHERPDPAGALRVVPSDLAGGRSRRLPAPPEDFETAIAGTEPWDVVGPVCESGDFLAKDRPLPRLDRGDLLAIFSAGAYGMVMASNYNTRPRAAEVLVDAEQAPARPPPRDLRGSRRPGSRTLSPERAESPCQPSGSPKPALPDLHPDGPARTPGLTQDRTLTHVWNSRFAPRGRAESAQLSRAKAGFRWRGSRSRP